MHIFHKWELIAVSKSGTCTYVLYKSTCGKAKTKFMLGVWTLEQLKAPTGPAIKVEHHGHE